MYAYEDRLVLVPFSLYESHVLQSCALLAERDKAEVSPFCWHVHFFSHLYNRFLLQAVGDEVLDGDDFHSPFLCLYLEVRHTSHCSVVVHDFHERTCWLQSCEAAEVDGCLCVSAASQHAVVLCIERIDVARASECLRCGSGVGESLDGLCAVMDRHACGASLELVHRNGERSAEHAGVVAYLMGEVKLLASGERDGHAEHASCVLEHEIHFLGCDLLGCDDEVALVLAVFIVHDDYEFSFLEVLHCIFDAA